MLTVTASTPSPGAEAPAIGLTRIVQDSLSRGNFRRSAPRSPLTMALLRPPSRGRGQMVAGAWRGRIGLMRDGVEGLRMPRAPPSTPIGREDGVGALRSRGAGVLPHVGLGSE